MNNSLICDDLSEPRSGLPNASRVVGWPIWPEAWALEERARLDISRSAVRDGAYDTAWSSIRYRPGACANAWNGRSQSGPSGTITRLVLPCNSADAGPIKRA